MGLIKFKLKDKGLEVRQLQKHLGFKGKKKVKVDGKFGRKTEEALKEFQQEHKMKVDGEAGPKVFKALDMKIPDPKVTQSNGSSKLQGQKKLIKLLDAQTMKTVHEVTALHKRLEHFDKQLHSVKDDAHLKDLDIRAELKQQEKHVKLVTSAMKSQQVAELDVLRHLKSAPALPKK